MSQRSASIALRHMLDHAREAISMARGLSPVELVRDRQLSLAVVHLLEIVGEAAGRVPRDKQEKLPGIEWAQIVGLRNRLIHGYDAVDWDIVHEIVNQDLPVLVIQLERALAADPDRPPQ